MLGDHDYNLGRRPYRPVKRRPPTVEDMPDEATAELIREAIRKYPKATAEEVGAFVHLVDHGPEFDVKAIRAVMHFG